MQDELMSSAVALGALYGHKLTLQEVDNVSKFFKLNSLDELGSLKYSQAEDGLRHNLCFIVGSAGCGKSTFINTLMMKLLPGRGAFTTQANIAGMRFIDSLQLKESIFTDFHNCGAPTINNFYSRMRVYADEDKRLKENFPNINFCQSYAEYILKGRIAFDEMVELIQQNIKSTHPTFFKKLSAIVDDYLYDQDLDRTEPNSIDIEEFLDWCVSSQVQLPPILKASCIYVDEAMRLHESDQLGIIYAWYAVRLMCKQSEKRLRISRCPILILIGSATQSSIIGGGNPLSSIFASDMFMKHVQRLRQKCLKDTAPDRLLFYYTGTLLMFYNRRMVIDHGVSPVKLAAYNKFVMCLEQGDPKIPKQELVDFIDNFVTCTENDFRDPKWNPGYLRLAKEHKILNAFTQDSFASADEGRIMMFDQYIISRRQRSKPPLICRLTEEMKDELLQQESAIADENVLDNINGLYDSSAEMMAIMADDDFADDFDLTGETFGVSAAHAIGYDDDNAETRAVMKAESTMRNASLITAQAGNTTTTTNSFGGATGGTLNIMHSGKHPVLNFLRKKVKVDSDNILHISNRRKIQLFGCQRIQPDDEQTLFRQFYKYVSQAREEQLHSATHVKDLNIRMMSCDIDALQNRWTNSKGGGVTPPNVKEGTIPRVKPVYIAHDQYSVYRIQRKLIQGMSCCTVGKTMGFILQFIGNRLNFLKLVADLNVLGKNLDVDSVSFFLKVGLTLLKQHTWVDIFLPPAPRPSQQPDPDALALAQFDPNRFQDEEEQESSSSSSFSSGNKQQQQRQQDQFGCASKNYLSEIIQRLTAIGPTPTPSDGDIIQEADINCYAMFRRPSVIIPEKTRAQLVSRYNGMAGIANNMTDTNNNVFLVTSGLEWHMFADKVCRGATLVDMHGLQCWILDKYVQRDMESSAQEQLILSDDAGAAKKQKQYPLKFAAEASKKYAITTAPLISDLARTFDVTQGSTITYPHVVLFKSENSKFPVTDRQVLVAITRARDLNHLVIADGGPLTKEFRDRLVRNTAIAPEDFVDLPFKPCENNHSVQKSLVNMNIRAVLGGYLGAPLIRPPPACNIKKEKKDRDQRSLPKLPKLELHQR